MELLAKELYRCPQFELNEGETTVGREEITEEKKAQLVADFPEVFEVLDSVENSDGSTKKGKK